jgi:hypothetical protein
VAGEIRIKVDDSEVKRALRGFERQLPYAMARALSDVAVAAQSELRGDLGKYVILRRAWVQRGIQIKRASKTDPGGPTAWVGTQDAVMAAMATGGVRPKTGRDDPMVPTGGKGFPRATPKTVTGPKTWPERLLETREKATGATAYFRDARGNVVKKTGPLVPRQRYHTGSKPLVRQARDGGRASIRVAWRNPQHAIQMRKRWPMEPSVRAVVLREWAAVAARWVNNAIASSWERASR